MSPPTRRFVSLLVVLSVISTACSFGSSDEPDASDGAVGTTTAAVPTGNPGTLVPPTTTTEAPIFALPIAPTVAFLDACIADDSLVGPCHCASERLEANFFEGDIIVFEDRLSGRNEFSPEVAAALVDCRDAAAPPPWPQELTDRYMNGCKQGSDRLADLCRCSAFRAQDVIPADRFDEFLVADDVNPGFVELINTCL